MRPHGGTSPVGSFKTMTTEKTTDSYDHVLKYTGIFGGVQGLNIIVSLVRNKCVALLLGPNGMGLASLFNTTVTFLSQATNFGISFSAVKNVSELFDRGDEAAVRHFVKVVRAWSLLTALLGMLLCIVASPLLDRLTFTWGNHTLHFLVLSLAVGMMAITGGETAILKGARQLRSLAVIQIVAVLATLVVSIPIYYFFYESGVVPVIVLMAFVTMGLTIRHSYRLYPLELKGARGLLGEGMGMIRLGVAFVAAGIIGSGAEMFIRSYMNVSGRDLDFVGLYNAGFMLTVTYVGMVFSAMETDYFPRLSAVPVGDREGLCHTINRQIEVTLLLVAPMLAAFVVMLPLLVPLLLSEKFLPMVPMAQVAAFSMLLKALSLPMGYTNLARSNSMGYLILETVYYVVFVLLVIWGFEYWGLLGTGIALVVSYAVEVLTVGLYIRHRYGYKMSTMVVRYSAIQFTLCVLAYLTTFIASPALRWVLGCAMIIASVGVSVAILHKKTSLWNTLVRKVLKRD